MNFDLTSDVHDWFYRARADAKQIFADIVGGRWGGCRVWSPERFDRNLRCISAGDLANAPVNGTTVFNHLITSASPEQLLGFLWRAVELRRAEWVVDAVRALLERPGVDSLELVNIMNALVGEPFACAVDFENGLLEHGLTPDQLQANARARVPLAVMAAVLRKGGSLQANVLPPAFQCRKHGVWTGDDPQGELEVATGTSAVVYSHLSLAGTYAWDRYGVPRAVSFIGAVEGYDVTVDYERMLLGPIALDDSGYLYCLNLADARIPCNPGVYSIRQDGTDPSYVTTLSLFVDQLRGAVSLTPSVRSVDPISQPLWSARLSPPAPSEWRDFRVYPTGCV